MTVSLRPLFLSGENTAGRTNCKNHTLCPVKTLPAGRIVKSYSLSGENLAGRTNCKNHTLCPAKPQSAGRTARSEKATARILQKAFSHITSLSRQKPDRAVLISGAEEAALHPIWLSYWFQGAKSRFSHLNWLCCWYANYWFRGTKSRFSHPIR